MGARSGLCLTSPSAVPRARLKTMPTNKLWLEHTERAAWQSVDALREKLVDAERRIERLAPPVAGWAELLKLLDALKPEYPLAGDTYAELMRSACDELTQLRGRVRLLERELAQRGTSAAVPPPAAVLGRRSPASGRGVADDEEDDEGPSRVSASGAEPRLFREIRRRARDLARERGHLDPESWLADIVTRLEEIPELDAGEIADAAADLGALSLSLSGSTAFEDND
jgi:hypothetical protein